MSNYNIEVKKSWWRNRWYLKMIAENGEVVLSGELLHNRKDAVETAENIALGKFIVVDNN